MSFAAQAVKYRFDCARCRERQRTEEFFKKDCGTCKKVDLDPENATAWELFQDWLFFGEKAFDLNWFQEMPRDEQFFLKEKLKAIIQAVEQVKPGFLAGRL